MRGLRRQNVQLREERGEGVLGLSDVLPDDARQVDKTEMRAHAVGGHPVFVVLPVPLSPAKRALRPAAVL
jgi:hypothetical protein